MTFAKNMRLRWRRRRFARNKIDFKKGLYLLPHLFTLGNAFFGFCSALFACRGEYAVAAHFILLGALMDMLDGRIARFMGITSDLGVQLDSLSDLISFCFAPAFLVYHGYLKQLGFLGVIISFLFCAAGMLRLARFNIIHQTQSLFFLGLPTTIAGCFLVIVILNTRATPSSLFQLIFYSALVLSLAYLMISTLHFPAFKSRLFSEKKHWQAALIAAVSVIFFVLRLHGALLVLFLAYFIYAVMYMRRAE